MLRSQPSPSKIIGSAQKERRKKGISLTIEGTKSLHSQSYHDLSIRSLGKVRREDNLSGKINRSDSEPRHIKLVVKAKG